MDWKRLAKGLRSVHRFPEILRCMRRSAEWPCLVPAFLGLRTLEFPREFRTPFGDVLTLKEPHDLVVVWVIYYRDDHPVDPSWKVIVDAGANIGAFSLYAARRAPVARIVALEPFPTTHARLRAHIERNGLTERVACRPWALAGRRGRRFMIVDASLPSQWRNLTAPEDPNGEAMPVEAVTLSDVWQREGLDQVDLLKIDIEGSEHEVFLNTPDEVLKTIRNIGMEYHDNAPKSRLFGRLSEAGFQLVHDEVFQPDHGIAHFRRA
jgi:FkbM family methyltransferase